MARIEDCPGFETFGADIKEARKAKRLTRKDLAEKVNVDTRYLANIENKGTIPSLPVIMLLYTAKTRLDVNNAPAIREPRIFSISSSASFISRES